MVEALGDIIVLHRHHVLDGGQGGFHGFFHLVKQKLWLWEKLPGERRRGKKSDLFVLNLECGEAGLQLLTPLEQFAFQWLLCTHHSHLRPHSRNSLKWQHHKNIRPYPADPSFKKKCLRRTWGVPYRPCGTGNQSELEDRRRCCRSPSVSACPRWLPNSLWLPPASPGQSVWTSLHSVQQTGRSSGLVAGWHGSRGHSTVTHTKTEINTVV